MEPDRVAQLVGEVGIVGELELPHSVRVQPVCAPDALHRADGDAGLLGHRGAGPLGRLGGSVSVSATTRARPPAALAAGCARAASCHA